MVAPEIRQVALAQKLLRERAMRRVTHWALLSATAMLTRSLPGAACLAAPLTYTLDGASPAPGETEVPLDAPLAIRSINAPSFGDGAVISSVAPLTDTTGKVIDVRYLEVGPRGNAVMSFIPLAPLEPNTTYVVDLGKPPVDAAPDAKVSWQFTTGATLAPPLRLKGELSVTYELGTDPHYDCSSGPSLCGPCKMDGEVDVTHARVQLPASFDGFSALGVQAELRVQEPGFDGSSGAWTIVDPAITGGEIGEAVVTMPLREDGAAYAPCFEFDVMDAHGDHAVQSLCTDEPFPLPGAPPESMGGAGGEPARSGAPAGRQRTSAACSFGAPASGGASWLLCIGALVLARSRKSRPSSQRSTPSRVGAAHGSR